MAENQPMSIADAIREARERLGAELRAQAEHILKLNQELSELQLLHGRTEQEAARQWDALAQAAVESAEAAAAAVSSAAAEAAAAATAAANAAAAAVPKISPDEALEKVLTAVCNVTTCTLPEQLFEALTEEASHWGVRAAIFDVRGKAAWGASAHGFGPALSPRVMRSLIVQLSQDNPFRQVCETAAPVDTSAEMLRKNRNLLDRLKPAPHTPILLLPIRSAGSVSAIFYADPGDGGLLLPVNALKILAEFAGAQIDRLIALSGGGAEEEIADQEEAEATEHGVSVEEPAAEVAPAEPAGEVVAVDPAKVAETPAGAAPLEVAVEPPAAEPVAEALPAEVPTEPPAPAETQVEKPAVHEPTVELPAVEFPPEVPVVEAPVAPPEPPASPAEFAVTPPEAAPVAAHEPPPPLDEPATELIPPPSAFGFTPPDPPPPATPVVEPPPPPAPAAFDISQLSEAEQKVHKDAKRFARILVSEIELYNKTKVADGRKNHDLYKRLKSDIDRSRQTYEKRFGKVLSKQFDYFHGELLKALAMDDPALLGPDYPGSTA